MNPHRYTIERDPSNEFALQLRCSETGVVVEKGIDGVEFLGDTKSPFKAWKQARWIRYRLEAGMKTEKLT